MKILWLCNVILPDIAASIGKSASVTGGWLAGALDEIKLSTNNKIVICFPSCDDPVSGETGTLMYYSFNVGSIYKYNASNESFFMEVLDREKPDIVHVWGSEYPHCLAMINACEKKGLLCRTVISIQGLISLYGNNTDHYLAGLPECVARKKTVRDFLKNDSILKQREKFSIRGCFEVEAINKVKHVIGRTDWDHDCVKRVNPRLHYHFCNESLRGTFYIDCWQYDTCEKHSIFVSQCSYPLKGFHRMLEAMRNIVKLYPDTKLYTTGDNLLAKEGLIKTQRHSYYQIYLKKLIRKYKLENNVVFLGSLDAEQMKKQMLRANVFVSPSSIENSSNSLSEAMLLGVPCVASEVGGIRSMMSSGDDGYLYPFDETYLMEYYICRLFADVDLANTFSRNARQRALLRHDRNNNANRLLSIYGELLETQ